MNNKLIPFQFHTHQVRILPHEDGASFWVVAQDVTDALGYRMASDGLRRVPDKHKGTRSVRTPGGAQEMLCVDEPGLYRLVLRSDKPEAEPFMEWVTSEVLPSIRKTGGYALPAPVKMVNMPEAEYAVLLDERDQLAASLDRAEELLDLYRFRAEVLAERCQPKPKRPAPAPLSEEKREAIRERLSFGESRKIIAEECGVSDSAVYMIQREMRVAQ
jgi:prophage antirepressor-like protein